MQEKMRIPSLLGMDPKLYTLARWEWGKGDLQNKRNQLAGLQPLELPLVLTRFFSSSTLLFLSEIES